jgi:molybdate transport system substrate-binding protein
MKSKIILFIISLFLSFTSISSSSPKEIRVFAGSALKPPLEEIAKRFESKYGIKIVLTFGGSGFVLSQMELGRKGDIYFPGSHDFMERAKKKGIIYSDTERRIVYLIPAINVRKGNPKQIKSLNDLSRKGLKIAIANPDSVCVGLYAVDLLKFNKLWDKVKSNILTYAESCAKTAALIVMDKVDAIIGWGIFEKWNPEKIETIYINPKSIPKVAYVPIAISKFSKNIGSSEKFVEFVNSEGIRIFKKYGYITSVNEVRRYAPYAEIGEK